MSNKHTTDKDPLENIFLLAGRRKPVDQARADLIEQKTRVRWQKMLARRRNEQRRRRFAFIGGSVTVAVSAVFAIMFMSRLAVEAPVVATVVNVIGAPEIAGRGDAMTALMTDTNIRGGSVLETELNEGVGMTLASGHVLRLAEKTRVRIEAHSVVLDAGAIYLDSGGDGRVDPIEVRSRFASLHEFGTQYMVRLTDASLDISVREGAVRVAQGSTSITAFAGEMLRLDEAGRTLKIPVAHYGEPWAWVTQLASMPVIEGLSLSEFLVWLTREQGWQLEFATPELAVKASNIELHGSVAGLDGRQGLAAVMASTGWHYRLQGGVLSIYVSGSGR
jgi:ferric-dicitrate binding protein FerR (iron transport regulator)